MGAAGAIGGERRLSRILAYTSPMQGHVFPALAVLGELRARGHDVTVRTASAGLEAARELGLEARAIEPEIEAIEQLDWRARTPLGAAAAAADTFLARARHDSEDLRRAIADEAPDAVLVDILSWGALSAAEAWDGPWGAFCPLPLPLPSRDLPPFGPGLRPARGRPGRLRDSVARPIASRVGDRVIRDRVNEVRRAQGLEPLGHAHEIYLRPPLLLQMSAEPLEYPRSDLPASIVMVGPCSWDPPGDLPGPLAGIEEPLVLVTASSDFQNDGRLAQVAIEALSEEPVHVVATVPDRAALRLPGASNATVLPFTPHLPVLARSACAITHGGMGVTQKALERGLPVCVVPFGRDQFEVARRVEVAEAGSSLPPWRLRRDRLRERFHTALSRASGAARVAEGIAAAGGAAAAARTFEDRLLKPRAGAGDERR